MFAVISFASCSKDIDEPSGEITNLPDDTIIAFPDTTTLMDAPGFCKGAGFSYDVTKPYGEGVAWQIFDAAYLQYVQNSNHCNYITDDYSPLKEEEYYQSDSESELFSKVSARLSLGIDVPFFTLNASFGGSVSSDVWERSVYTLKRSKIIVFTRDIQYRNIMADVMSGNTELFSPAFRKDWSILQNMNDGPVDPAVIMYFLDKWGIAFVYRAGLGGALEYELKVDKSQITDSYSLEVAMEMSIKYLLNAGLNAEYKEAHTYISERSYSRMIVRGGDISKISKICRGEAVSQAEYLNWMGTLAQNGDITPFVSLVDISIAPISELFTGKVRTEIERQINLK